jgi:hypothetical protein
VPFVSVTRLHLASSFSFPAFLFYALSSSRQASRSAGFRGGWLGRDAESGFWTVTVWDNADAMRAYRNSGIHLRAMPKLVRWCDEAAIAHFEQPGDAAPDPAAAYERMKNAGKLSKVAKPSARHQSGATVGNSTAARGQVLKPRAG